jgi:hypothetical protein
MFYFVFNASFLYEKHKKIFGGRRAPDPPTGVWFTNVLTKPANTLKLKKFAQDMFGT